MHKINAEVTNPYQIFMRRRLANIPIPKEHFRDWVGMVQTGDRGSAVVGASFRRSIEVISFALSFSHFLRRFAAVRP